MVKTCFFNSLVCRYMPVCQSSARYVSRGFAPVPGRRSAWYTALGRPTLSLHLPALRPTTAPVSDGHDATEFLPSAMRRHEATRDEGIGAHGTLPIAVFSTCGPAASASRSASQKLGTCFTLGSSIEASTDTGGRVSLPIRQQLHVPGPKAASEASKNRPLRGWLLAEPGS